VAEVTAKLKIGFNGIGEKGDYTERTMGEQWEERLVRVDQCNGNSNSSLRFSLAGR
jgi:hypothetical protein